MGYSIVIIIVGLLCFIFLKPQNEMPPLKGGRTMFEGMSRQEVENWISIAPIYKKLDKNIVNAVLNRLFGKDFLDVFILVIADPQIIHEINQLAKSINSLANKEEYELIACAIITDYFTKKSIATLEIAHNYLSKKTSMSEDKFMQLFGTAVDMAEVSIHIEPNCLMAYITMAQSEIMLNKKESARAFCDQCLEKIDKMQNSDAFNKRFGQSTNEIKKIALQLKDEISKN